MPRKSTKGPAKGGAYGNLGNAYQSLGNYQLAVEYHKQGLDIAKEVSDRAGVGHAYSCLGRDFYSFGDFERAIECHKEDMTKEVGDRAGQGKPVAISATLILPSTISNEQKITTSIV